MIMMEMEGARPLCPSSIILTTNYIQAITPAILRRLTASLHVPGLDAIGRQGIISRYNVTSRKVEEEIVLKTEGWGGADVHTLLKRSHELAVSSLLAKTDVGVNEDWTVPNRLKEQVKGVQVGGEVWKVMSDMLGEAEPQLAMVSSSPTRLTALSPIHE